MYKRKIESILQQWKAQPKRKPLIIKGVRQCEINQHRPQASREISR